jgi:hypothetical protein
MAPPPKPKTPPNKTYENKKPKTPHKLNLKAVCERAKSIPGCRLVYPNPSNTAVTITTAGSPDTVAAATASSPSNKQHAKGNANHLNNNDALVSFMVDLPVSPNKGSSSNNQNSTNNNSTTNKRDVARVNIFCDTGTVGVCRLLHGQVRQTFRRSVTSLDVVERLLRSPPELTNIDASLVERFEPVTQEDKKAAPTTILQQDLELAEVGLYILQGERDKLSSHLTALEEKEDDGTKASHDTSDDDGHHHHRGHHAPTPMAAPLDVVAGMEFQFSLPVETMTQVEQCLQDISSLGKIVKHVATNGKSTIFLYGHGGVAYTSHIPKPLHHRLKQLQRSAPEKRPCYVSLGGRERYFVGFYDGTADWRGPKALDKILKERMFGNNTAGGATASSNSSSATSVSTLSTSKSNFPQSVAFGSTYDTFFVVFGDGSWLCEGKGIPDALEDKLADRADRADLVCVTLGPKGEWFLRAENGRMWWGGISSELDQLIQDLLESGNYLSFIDFGDDGSYFVSYDDAEETEEDEDDDK